MSAAAADDDTRASSSRSGDPAAPQALGRVFAAGPTAPALFLVSSGGYGYTESVLNSGDTHHRAAGSVGHELVGVMPEPVWPGQLHVDEALTRDPVLDLGQPREPEPAQAQPGQDGDFARQGQHLARRHA